MITNNMVKYFQSLKHQKYRLKYKQFLIEGKRIITEAVKNDFMFHIVLYTEKFKIKCERKFEINQNNTVIGFTSKNCF